MKRTVVLADDHPVVLEGLRKLVEPDYDVVATATNGKELLRKAAAAKPDVVLVDVSMPLLDGISATQELRRLLPDTKIVVLTMHADLAVMQEAFLAGASGYVLKTSAPTDLNGAIREVLTGRIYVPPVLAGEVVRDWLLSPRARKKTVEMTPRNREVLKLVSDGYSNKEIAATLNISVKTVEFHKSRLMRKLGLKSSAELVRYASEHGLIE
jgi:DNA-binding NarL/FixJ family response regulator